ncbi:uncharacterized protein LOC131654295 [Vicia villosa]|uniref:uncharacterized protein LOC131654295 n=1 Tax=Vicia villosa TaxID=3911 RepID=UPI00273B2A4F|nr:uncharacterized protein LOC131654295 [Vicia villosa]
MIVESLNIRGGGSLVKRKSISNLISIGRADIFFIQESKLKEVDLKIVDSLWKNEKVGWSFVQSEGRSGGLITMWKEGAMEIILSFRRGGILGTKVKWKGVIVYLVNIYSPCSLRGKKELWKDLLELRAIFSDGYWLMGGDFNAVKKRSERKGRSSGGGSEASLFSGFIKDSRLIDMPCNGNRFSWYSGDGFSMSRLDRFLVDDFLIDRWGMVGQKIGDRSISDHCPIWTVSNKENWGPKPFVVNNAWFEDTLFLPFVEEEWRKLRVEGRGDFILKEKLRMLKEKLRWWNREVFGRIDMVIEEGKKGLNETDRLLTACKEGEVGGLVDVRSEATKIMWLNMRLKENILLQKSRVKWDKEGDLNSRYFHNIMKARRRRNFIGSVTTEGGVLDEVGPIKEEVRRHFEEKFSELEAVRPTLEGSMLKSISLVDKGMLEEPFSEEEIKDAVWGCEGTRSPGPDGYNFFFIRKCWSFMKKDFSLFFNGFYADGILSKATVSSFINLIPKKESPSRLDDFRPICLVGCLYKAISKLLASRLKKVLNSVISEVQSAFVPCRNLLDGVMVANEIMDYAVKEKKGCLLFKVDFEKAYDSVNWPFLFWMLKKLGFGERWIS